MLIDSFIGYLKVERNCSPHTLRAYAKDLSSFKDYIARVDESLSFLNVDTDVVRMWVYSWEQAWVENICTTKELQHFFQNTFIFL